MQKEILIPIAICSLLLSPLVYQFFIWMKEDVGDRVEIWTKFKKILTYTASGFVLIFGVVLALNHINFLNYKKPIEYDNVENITFNDFKGFEFFRKSLYGTNRFAYVVTTIDTDIQENEVLIKALFHPSRSFVYNSKINSSELLQHEIYHFRITELFARKIKKRISVIKNPSKGVIEKIIIKAKSEEKILQKAYDKDTFHSYILKEQKKYEKNIDSLLYLLNKFKQPKIIIK